MSLEGERTVTMQLRPARGDLILNTTNVCSLKAHDPAYDRPRPCPPATNLLYHHYECESAAACAREGIVTAPTSRHVLAWERVGLPALQDPVVVECISLDIQPASLCVIRRQ